MSSAPVQIVVMGVSATGKSVIGKAVAAELGYDFIEGDDYHPRSNIEKMSAGIALTDQDRMPWLAALGAVIARRDSVGRSTVVTCSALRRSYRDILRAAAPGSRLFFVHLHASFEVLQARMAHRTKHFMPASLLTSQFATLEPLGEDEAGVRVDVTPPLDQVVAAVLDALRPVGT